MAGDDLWGTTMPAFSFSLRWPEEAPSMAEVRLWVQPEGHRRAIRWGTPWPGKGALVPAGALLDVMTSSLLVVGAGYLEGAPDDGEGAREVADLGAPLGQDGPVMVAAGRRLHLSEGGRDVPFGPDGVGVVEAILCLGALCARRLSGIAAESGRCLLWAAARDRVGLFPVEPDIVPDGDLPPFGPVEAAVHWSGRLGQDPDAYRRAATWLVARQWLHAANDGVAEPSGEDWDATSLPQGLPGEVEVLALARKADAAMVGPGHVQGRSCLVDGLAERNLDARRVVHLRGWPRTHRV